MKAIATAALAAIVLVPALASAQTCPDMSSLTIPAPWTGAEKCISAVAKASTKFVGSKLKAQDKCRKARAVGACVDTTPATGPYPYDDGENGDPIRRDQKTTDKIIKAMSKAGDQIAKKCDSAATAAFPNSYSTETPETVASCMLGQNNATAALISWNNNGASAPIIVLGTCNGGGNDGGPCADDSGCSSGVCSGGNDGAACGADTNCGECVGGDAAGTVCVNDNPCTGGGICTFGTCGAPGVCEVPKSNLQKCADKFASSATKFVRGALKTINKCVDGQIKAGATGGIAEACVGSYAGGVWVGPTDSKTNDKLTKAQDKALAAVEKSCGAFSSAEIASLNACPDATDVAGLEACMVCDNWSRIYQVVNEQYSESGTYVAHGGGVGVLQAAWDAAMDGTKYLVGSGIYTSDPGDGGTDDPVILMTQSGTCAGGDTPGATCSNLADCPGAATSCDNASPAGVQFVGCVDTSTGDRPSLEPDGAPNAHANGVFTAGIDGLVFQSLSIFDWDDNGIFNTDSEGLTYRDIYGHGGVEFTTYSIFPVSSDDVLVEGCFVSNIDDAGVYVGSSTNYTVRWNMVTDSVAGIEIENSINARTHNNESYGNTGGLLVFMLTGPPLQASHSHETDHNVLVSNNVPNFGTGTVGNVPTGTGLLVIATDDSSYHHNYVANNDSLGMAVIDQVILSVISGDGGDCCSPSFDTVNNTYTDNILDMNGANVDPATGGVVPDNAQNVMILAGPADHNNCWANNTLILPPAVAVSDAESFSPANDCTP